MESNKGFFVAHVKNAWKSPFLSVKKWLALGYEDEQKCLGIMYLEDELPGLVSSCQLQ